MSARRALTRRCRSESVRFSERDATSWGAWRGEPPPRCYLAAPTFFRGHFADIAEGCRGERRPRGAPRARHASPRGRADARRASVRRTAESLETRDWRGESRHPDRAKQSECFFLGGPPLLTRHSRFTARVPAIRRVPRFRAHPGVRGEVAPQSHRARRRRVREVPTLPTPRCRAGSATRSRARSARAPRTPRRARMASTTSFATRLPRLAPPTRTGKAPR